MELRRMKISDLRFFNKVRKQSSQYLHDSTNFTLEENINWFIKYDPIYFILSNDNQDIGYFRTSNWNNNTVYLGLDIAEEYRGKGYARKAYNLMFDYLKKQNISTIFLEVLQTNKRAIHIYESLGFEITEIKQFKTTKSIKMKLNINNDDRI